jgi:hypothetical protein
MKGTTKPGEVIDQALLQRNLGLRVFLEGTASQLNNHETFNVEASTLRGVGALHEKLGYARNVTNGLDSSYLDRYFSDFSALARSTAQELYTYQPLQRGVLGTGEFPMLITQNDPGVYHSVSLTVVNARTITVSSGDGLRVYYLADGNINFDYYLDKFGHDGDAVYFYGDVYTYVAQNGAWYTLMQPTEVSSVAIRNPVEVAQGVIASRLGYYYAYRYFFVQDVEYNSDIENFSHTVILDYRVTVGNYSNVQQIYLDFNQNWNLTQSTGIPLEGNLQPFKVTESMARVIALGAGVPKGPYGLGSDVWYFGYHMGVPSAYEGKYAWYV